jgi:hypothetical protein
MVSTKAGLLLLTLGACCFAVLSACRLPAAAPEDSPPATDPEWTFDAGLEGWSLVLIDGASENDAAELSWSATQGFPEAGALKIVVPFQTVNQYVSVVAPIVVDPFAAGRDFTGKKFTVQVRSEASFTGGAVIFSNTGDAFTEGTGSVALLDTTSWVSLELDLTAPSPPYDPADVRFLGVIFATRDTDPPDLDYTFYVDTALMQDAP